MIGLSEGKEILPEVVGHLERIRSSLKDIKPRIPEELIFPKSAAVKVIYPLKDCQTEIHVVVEPRYLKYLGLEIPEWLLKLLRK